ncbi:MAG: Fe-S protein [Burkholderiales bacterium]
MSRLFSNRQRQYDMGVLPSELLARDADAAALPAAGPGDVNRAASDSVAVAFAEYEALFATHLEGAVAPRRAPLPDDLVLRARNLKASAYFLDATLAGVCALEDADWQGADRSAHTHAFVFVVEFGREPGPGEPGDAWMRGTNVKRTDVRVAEVAVVLAGYVRALGYAARGHCAGATQVVLERLAQRAGVAKAVDGMLRLPFTRRGFAIGVVTTDMALAADLPIAASASLDWPDADAYMGKPGTRPGWQEAEEATRPMHLGRYPMETIKRVAEPTTLVLRDEIMRNSKRADLFTRALAGDLGEKPKAERMRFATKHPLALAMTPLIRNMVPLQGSREPLLPTGIGGDLSDARRNADAIKALGYYLGADLVGICEAEPWMYYSHDAEEGKPIAAYHRHCVVMLIDQGFETMEGASGDDWISGAQSMRAYMRGALIAGVMAAHLRRLGFSARSQTNAHSEVLHIPAALMAGLGELSRIGELVLNPFIGPRSKSVLVTTDLPLEFDLPIDFGLQAVCNMCFKCARECPCNAIPFGPKVMFNGYEIWKPDVEKCGKYRLTNMKGSACGRCMKTCPYNREDLVESDRLLDLSIRVPSARRALIDYDDSIGGGIRNPVKRWWFDLEIVDGVCVTPRGANERDLDLGRGDKLAREQKLAFYPPSVQPAGGTTVADVVPLDRVAGQKAYAEAERPMAARRRRAAK